MELEVSENNVEEPSPNPTTEDQVQEENLGTLNNPHPTFVNAHIKGKELENFMYFLHDFVDCFAWNSAECRV